MSFVVTATTIIGSAVIGGVVSSDAARKESHASERATNATVDEQRRQYDQTREDFAPWRESGQAALGRLDRASSGDRSDFFESPDYQFRVDEGNRNTENRFSVGGGGGNAMKALAAFNSNLASTEYGNWWDRQAGLTGQGRAATGATAAAGSAASANIGNAYMNNGRAQGNAAWGAAAGINNALNSGISNYLYARKPGDPGGDIEQPDYWGNSNRPQFPGGLDI